MRPRLATVIELSVLVSALLLSPLVHAHAQKADTPPNMAPLDQYLIADQNAEIAFAKSAAPKVISENAEIMVLDRLGYKTAVKGMNGFVCLVQRSWAAGYDAPEFWNPQIRSPICLNPPAARSFLPILIAKTRLALAGKSKAETFDAILGALDKKELPALETGAMCYMMSKEAHLSDRDGHWHPHVMFFLPSTDAKVWGANVLGSPFFAGEDIPGRLTKFLLPVQKWSDGTADSHDKD